MNVRLGVPAATTMVLTRDFKETVVERARRDATFREAMFTQAFDACLAGDTRTGKAMLRDLVNATIGFEGLAEEVKKRSKLNTSVSTVQKWEIGDKKPSGPALKLLALVDRKGLKVLA